MGIERNEKVTIRRGLFTGRTGRVTQAERGGRVGVLPDGAQFALSLAASSVARVEKGAQS